MQFRFTFLLLLFFSSTSGQDSTSKFKVQRLLLQPTFSSSSNFDNGKHFSSLHYQQIHSPFLIHSSHVHLTYSTKFQKHSIGVKYNSEAFATAYSTQSIGIQYAYTINFNRTFLGNKTVIIPGIELAYAKNNIHEGELNWYDQIDKHLGFVLPTNESIPKSTITYYNIPFSLLLRSEKLYLQYHCSSLNTPVLSPGTIYSRSFDEYNLNRIQTISFGSNLYNLRNISIWLTTQYIYDPLTIESSQYLNGLGVGTMLHIFQYWLLGYNYSNHSSEITVAFDSKNLRFYSRYNNTPNPYFNYFYYGKFSIGISTNISKL